MLQIEKQVAIAAARSAAALCEQVRAQQDEQTIQKTDRSPVTIADFGCQAAICQALQTNFPDDPVVAEEDAAMLKQQSNHSRWLQITEYVKTLIPAATPEDVAVWIDRGNGQVARRYWTLDPIDGTKGFIRGDRYAIALALIEDGEVRLGVLACPSLPFNPEQPTQDRGVLFVAVRGEGTEMISLNSDRSISIRVNQWQDGEKLRLIESVESAHSDRSKHHALAAQLGITQTFLQMDSQAKYGAVARGQADLYLRIPRPEKISRRENIWDHAAGAIVVTEAGGKVTDLDGKNLDFSLGAKLSNNRGIVASNGAIHNQVLGILAKMQT
ncbi:3'(2'),5'-bisphosphate nucleotidase [Oscillatoria salina]|uniref:3'(2'),5'-bisphosphate nucleotidase n=1 Tax=Oscillatoria salina TaxID=331517 RepID=UPI0013B86040|nr:3'(2'),5'-bisphosphate nucleotidase [Oscillatoria salina]MBZ8179387.1 3'(2'),5'-bisphosphate nucleotidase [Oscillatoria salina IIICB1]NET87874.1 3'(2'),5'-bisphosphate nucleotidase [Kamptonema sp. SIO1D9]